MQDSIGIPVEFVNGQTFTRYRDIPHTGEPVKECAVTTKETIGQRVRRLRLAQKKRQTQLAKEAGCSQVTVSDVERDRYPEQLGSTLSVKAITEARCSAGVIVVSG